MNSKTSYWTWLNVGIERFNFHTSKFLYMASDLFLFVIFLCLYPIYIPFILISWWLRSQKSFVVKSLARLVSSCACTANNRFTAKYNFKHPYWTKIWEKKYITFILKYCWKTDADYNVYLKMFPLASLRTKIYVHKNYNTKNWIL